MKSSSLLAGLLALLIACGVSFGAGYYVAKVQGENAPAPKALVSDKGDDQPSLDGDPLEMTDKPVKPDAPKTEGDNNKTPAPDVTPKPENEIKPVVDSSKPPLVAPPADPKPETEATPADPAKKKLEDELAGLKDKLKDLEGMNPEDFEDIFNGPQVDFSATVSGTVVDQLGVAVAGAGIHASYSENYSSDEGGTSRVSFVMSSGESSGTVIATTDASGSFSATISRKISEKASLQVSLTAKADGFAESEKTSFKLKNGDDKQGLKLALRGAGSVSGRVVDASGQGVSGVTVGLNTQGGGNFYGSDTLDLDFGGGSKYSAQTDAGGEFTIEGIAEGRYKFKLSGAGYRQISGPTEIDVKAGQSQRAPADFQVAITASISAKFTSGDGRAIPGWVTLAFKDDTGKIIKRLSGQVESDGSFSKNDPPAGTFDIEITVWGYKPQTVRTTVLEGQRCDLGTITLEQAEGEGGSGIFLPEDE